MKIKKLLKAILYTVILIGSIYLFVTYAPGFGKHHPTIKSIINSILLAVVFSLAVWAVYMTIDD